MTAQLAMKSRRNDAPLLLEKVSVRGSVHASLARVKLEQRYRNDTGTNVEAVYTFPLPPAAVLLRTVVTLAGKKYEGTVLAREKAEGRYEEAIEQGDTAIMVERPEPGIYTMNLGNLMAGETASVEIEFAQLLDWSHGRLRLALPMTIAPRYGEERSALQPQQKPHIDALVERPFDLELRIATGGKVHSPSHPIAARLDDGDMVVSLLRESAWMDRDFVMVVDAGAPKPFATVARAGESQVGFVSFQVPEVEAAAGGRDVRIVVDCSGSMAGDSIALARAGAINLLNRLRAQDRFALVAFGSQHRSFHPAVASATERGVEAAITWVQALEADMGGTELAGALEAIIGIEGTKGRADIFLVTDGQVGQAEETVQRVRKLGHRVFVVGIGVSPSRGLLEAMTQATGGAIDYIAPGEDVAEAIGRQFARVTQEPLRDLSVDWGPGVEGDWRTGTVEGRGYSGDTIHAFAGVRSSPRSISVSYTVRGKRSAFEVPVALVPAALAGDVVHRVAASQRIREGLAEETLDRGGAEALALQHQLVTQFTNYILVIDRGEGRAGDSPVVTPVPTMLAEGWGGAGMLLGASIDHLSIGDIESVAERSMTSFSEITPPATLATFLLGVTIRFGGVSNDALPLTLDGVRRLGLPEPIVAELARAMLDHNLTEEAVLRAFWAAYAIHVRIGSVDRGLERKLRAAANGGDANLAQALLAELRSTTAVT